MEITKEEQQTLTVTVVENILCNKCGKSIRYNKYTHEGTRLTGDFGWGSVVDGLREHFDLCDKCYGDFTDTFTHPPTEF